MMINTVLLFLLTLIPVFVLAQRVNYPPAPSSVYAPYQQNASSQIKSTLWSDEISTSANWSFSNASLPNNDWTIETDSTIVSTTGLIQTTSSSNGFLLFRADTTQGATSESFADYSGATIDLTGNPDVRIQFEQQYISDSNQRIIELSADGILWTPYFISDGNSATGERIDDLGSINVSSVIGNATTAFFRFKFSGTNNGYWAVDDIKINSIDSVDLRAVSVDWGTTGAWGVRMPYYSIIDSQVQPIEFCLKVANDGLLDIDTVIYSLTEPTTSINLSDTFSIQANSEDTICSFSYNPDQNNNSNYNFDQSIFTTQIEQNEFNNELNNIRFKLDYGWSANYARDDIFSTNLGEINSQDMLEYEVGNVFDFFEGECMTDIRVYISPDATIGSEVYGKLYRFDTIVNNFIFEDQTFTEIIDFMHLGDYIDLSLAGGSSQSYCENENTSYLATVLTYGGVIANYSNVVSTSGKSKPNTSFLIDWTSNQSQFGDWYYLTETPMVRLLTYPHGLDEYQSNFNFNISPNPANATTTLSFELPASSMVSFEVIDLSGKTVNRMDSNHFEEGKNTFELTTNNLLNGVYFVKFTSDFGSTTKRIVINH